MLKKRDVNIDAPRALQLSLGAAVFWEGALIVLVDGKVCEDVAGPGRPRALVQARVSSPILAAHPGLCSLSTSVWGSPGKWEAQKVPDPQQPHH